MTATTRGQFVRAGVALAALCMTGATPAGPLHLRDAAAPEFVTAATPVKLFVRLDSPSVAEANAASLTRGTGERRAAAQRLHALRLAAEQDRVARRLRPLIVAELGRLRVAVNGIRVLAPAHAIPALGMIEGVKSVVPVSHYEIGNAASVDWIQAPELWATLGDGAGLTIAIIDTGIDYLHANFGGDGDPAAYADNDKRVIEPGSFPTVKVIGGWDFAGPTYNSRLDELPQPDPDPLDGNGHGSHVAGTAAGIGVDGRIGPGVARGAQLLALKVFSDGSGSTDLTPDAIERALDPNQDGAMDDAVDVINMSLGARFGHPDDPSALASSHAAQNGVIVVASAGNNGDKPYVTGAPAVSPEAISVAATIAGGRPRSALRVLPGAAAVAGLYVAAESASPARIVDQPMVRPLVGARSRATDADGVPLPGLENDQSCGRLLNSAELRDRIVLVARGGCSYETKFAVVQDAGAAGIVVYNTGAVADTPVTMGGIGASGKVLRIPGLMIGGTDGLTLRSALAEHPLEVEFNVANTVPALPEIADRLTFFSSRGPAHGGAGFKPDLSAPGRFIVSTDAGSGFRGRQLRGTSMAAPHIAGAAALLRQQHPDLGVAAIKALLQNASVDATYDGPDSNTPVPLSLQGVGVVRVADAAALRSYVAPAGVSFGYLNPAADIGRSVTTTLVNLSAQARTFAVTHRPRGTLPGAVVSCPDQVSVAAGGSASFDIGLSVAAALLPADPGRSSHSELDGWCVLSDGIETLRVGYLAALDPAANVTIDAAGASVTLGNDGVGTGRALGFRLLGNDADGSDGLIAATGFRLTRPFGFTTLEFALTLNASWEAAAHYWFELYVDSDRNGRFDRVLLAGDWSLFGFEPGPYATGVFALGADGEPLRDDGYLDWFADEVDFNDRVLVAPFTLAPELGLSFLKPDDRVFDYRLVVRGRNGNSDEQTGTLDLDADPVTSAETIVVPPGVTLHRDYADGLPDLWLLPANPAATQVQIAPTARPAPRSNRLDDQQHRQGQ